MLLGQKLASEEYTAKSRPHYPQLRRDARPTFLFHLMDSFIPANQWCPCPVQLVAFPEYYIITHQFSEATKTRKVVQTHVYNHRYNAFVIFGSHVGWLFSTSVISIHALSGYTQWWWFVELVTILPLMSRRTWLFQNQYDPIDPISKIIPNVGIAATNANISIMSIPNSCFKHPWRSVLRNLATLHSCQHPVPAMAGESLCCYPNSCRYNP